MLHVLPYLTLPYCPCACLNEFDRHSRAVKDAPRNHKNSTIDPNGFGQNNLARPSGLLF